MRFKTQIIKSEFNLIPSVRGDSLRDPRNEFYHLQTSHRNETKTADLVGIHTMHGKCLVIFNANRWHCRSCSLWLLWYCVLIKGEGPHLSAIGRQTTNSSQTNCILPGTHVWTLNHIEVSNYLISVMLIIAIKMFFQLLNWKFGQRIQ